MNPEQVISIVNMSVLPGWLLLAVAPRWGWTPRLVPVVMAIPLAVEADALRRGATYFYTSGSRALAFREGRADGTAWEYPVVAKARMGPRR
jgi:hypothetical protein